MTTAGGRDAALLSRERDNVFEALGDDALSGPAILRRMTVRPTEPGDQRLLYPALHSLEAGFKIRAEWRSDADGGRHRIYRKRHLLAMPRGLRS